MQTSECAIFHLSTCDINISNTTGDYANGYINSIGSINTFRTSITWFNVDFNTILGDMLKSGKYEKFNIKLSTVMYSTTAAVGVAAVDRTLKINMSGLPFANCTYHMNLLSNTNTCTMGAFGVSNTSSGQIYFNDDNVFSIYPPSPQSNITISLKTLYDVEPANGGTLFPQFDFYFRIYGILKN